MYYLVLTTYNKNDPDSCDCKVYIEKYLVNYYKKLKKVSNMCLLIKMDVYLIIINKSIIGCIMYNVHIYSEELVRFADSRSGCIDKIDFENEIANI